MISLVKQKRKDIEELCSRYNVARLEIFGSAANDSFDSRRSDIDFLVEYFPGTDLGPWMSRYFDFREELERLLGYNVDLVMISALKNPYFIKEVERTRVLLYEDHPRGFT